MNTTYQNLRVVVADNASTDSSVPYLKSHFPQVELILLKENHGFAKGYNEALKDLEADYFVLLNSDVEVTPGWLQPIISLLEADLKNGACQPKLLAYHKKDYFEYAGAAGGWLDAYGYPFARGRIFDVCEKDNGQYNDTVEVFWASGAAMVIRSSAFKELAGFDPYFFAHQEEIDLCWRLQLAGYKVFCCPQSVAFHVGGGTLPRGNSRKTFLNFRNNHIMLWKNLCPAEKWWKVPFRLLLDQVSAFKGLLSGQSGYFIAINRAHLAFFKWLVKGTRERHHLHRRKLSTLHGVFKGNIVWQHFALNKKYFGQIIKKEEDISSKSFFD